MKKALFTVISIIWILLIVGCSSFSPIPEEANETSRISSSSFDTDSAQDIKKSEVATSDDSKQVVPTNSSGQKKKNYKTFDSFGYDVEGEDLNALAEALDASDDYYGAFRIFDVIGIDTEIYPSLYKDNIRQWAKIRSGIEPVKYAYTKELLDYLVENQLFDYQFEVGDVGPAGGIVFYDKGYYSDGWRYLEAAPADLRIVNGVPSLDSSLEEYWDADASYIFGRPTSDGSGRVYYVDERLLHRTSTDFGTGKMNTEYVVLMMDSLPSSRAPENYAAKLCNDLEYSIGDVLFDDWFLPSADELEYMLKFLMTNKLHFVLSSRSYSSYADTTPSYTYWSSSAIGTYFAVYCKAFYHYDSLRSEQIDEHVYDHYSVHPIRAF